MKKLTLFIALLFVNNLFGIIEGPLNDFAQSLIDLERALLPVPSPSPEPQPEPQPKEVQVRDDIILFAPFNDLLAYKKKYTLPFTITSLFHPLDTLLHEVGIKPPEFKAVQEGLDRRITQAYKIPFNSSEGLFEFKQWYFDYDEYDTFYSFLDKDIKLGLILNDIGFLYPFADGGFIRPYRVPDRLVCVVLVTNAYSSQDITQQDLEYYRNKISSNFNIFADKDDERINQVLDRANKDIGWGIRREEATRKIEEMEKLKKHPLKGKPIDVYFLPYDLENQKFVESLRGVQSEKDALLQAIKTYLN